MKRVVLILSALVTWSMTSYAQLACGTDALEQQLRNQHPQILVEEQKFQEFMVDWLKNNKDNGNVRDDATYIVPIVFHIIHDYGSENISDDQVRDAVRILNEDYRKLNADTANIIPEFKSIAGDAKIEFRLANKTPGGLCTNGIEHIHSLITSQGSDQAKLSDWPRSMYLNVWTVKAFGADLVGVAGYAYYATTTAIPFLAPYDGVIILSDYVGSIGTGSYTVSHALTHEIGHTLNLKHCWGDNNNPGEACGDDGVFDTPLTKGWDHCPSPDDADVCTPGVIENYQNYMEYSYCSDMYTQGQIQIMNGTLDAPTADRSLMVSEDNLIATGTDDTIQTTCAPRIDFYASNYTVCTNTAITLYDVSWGGVVDGRKWNLADGNPTTSTAQNVTVSFATPGWKAITLTDSNSAGSSTLTQEKFIYVSDNSNAQYTGTYTEGFESPNTFTNDYIVQNRDDNYSEWQRINWAGHNSYNCVYLNNFQNLPGDIDALITPSFDLTFGSPIYLNFYYSSATSTTVSADITDVLRIYSSSDCGKTWGIRSTISGLDLANAGYYASGYVPNSQSPWIGKSIQLPANVLTGNIRFKFEFQSSGLGNSIYLDDINVSSFPVGVNDPTTPKFIVNINPNPFTQQAEAGIQLAKSEHVQVKVIDLAGRTIQVLNDGWLTQGTHTFLLDKQKLGGNGLYFLTVEDATSITRQKMVIQ